MKPTPCRFPRRTYRDNATAKESARAGAPKVRPTFCAPCGGWHLMLIISEPVVPEETA